MADMSDSRSTTSIVIAPSSLTPSSRLRLLAAVAIVGVLSGVAAWLLKGALALLPQWLTHMADALGSRWFMLPMPLVGVLLAAVLSRYVLRMNLEHGTAQIRNHLVDKQWRLSPRIILGSLLGNALTLGFGGSAGSESPMAYTGSSVAASVARWLRLTESQALMLIGIGGGAGIAAIFKSPIGGALFTIEVLGMTMPMFGLLLLFASTLIA
ncbi:MAG: chloride channel protein, partial [Muribaculaceae bacterium]|nr:chloride channel protein [Muribaculaceae bacterium]